MDIDSDTREVLEGAGVPGALIDEAEDLEEAGEDEPTHTLVLFRFKQENIRVLEGLSHAAVVEFCSQPAASGEGWFFGWRAE